ncbi:MAG TPA: DUF5654 family protein [Candidatus Bilamarchaeaceae archaeon]|nr:DUF5654 family protein [Candidatus Bilamarchaeaceae archaeon]
MVNVERVKQVSMEITTEFRERLVLLMTTAFGVVAALFWQDAIRDMINAFVPPGEGWQYELIIAILITFLAVLSLYILTKFGRK